MTRYEKLIYKAEQLEQAAARAYDKKLSSAYVNKAKRLRAQARDLTIEGVEE